MNPLINYLKMLNIREYVLVILSSLFLSFVFYRIIKRKGLIGWFLIPVFFIAVQFLSLRVIFDGIWGGSPSLAEEFWEGIFVLNLPVMLLTILFLLVFYFLVQRGRLPRHKQKA